MKDKVLVVAMTPMQVLCAIEACEKFFPDSQKVLINASPFQENQMVLKSCIELYQWDRLITLYNRNFVIPRFSYAIKNIIGFFHILEAIRYKDYNALIFGHYMEPLQRYLVNRFRNKQVILVDDGVFTFQLNHFRRLEVNGDYPIKHRSSLNSVLMRLAWGKKNLSAINMTLYTVYDVDSIPNTTVVKNNMTRLKLRMKISNVKDQNYFIGSNLSEMGMLKEQFYLDLLLKWKNQLESKDNPIYLAKFSENENKLKKIELLGFNIIEPSVPAELYFVLNRLPVSVLASVFSSALLNLYLFYGETNDIKFQYIRLGIKNVGKRHQKLITDVYKNYQKYHSNNFQELSIC